MVPSGARELSGRLSLPRAQRRNCRCRSRLSAGATPLRQVPPSFGKGCVSGRGPALPCPACRYQSVPSGSAPGYAPGSGCGVPHCSPVHGCLVRNPAGHYGQEGEARTGHLPAAHSTPGSDSMLESKTLHPPQPWGAVWGGGKHSKVVPPRVNNSPGGSASPCREAREEKHTHTKHPVPSVKKFPFKSEKVLKLPSLAEAATAPVSGRKSWRVGSPGHRSLGVPTQPWYAVTY